MAGTAGDRDDQPRWATRPPGMRAKAFIGLLALLLVLYSLSVSDLVLDGPITRLDAALAGTIRSLHTQALDQVFAAITACGVWQVMATLFALATIGLVALRRFGLVLGLWLTFAGKQLTVAVLKEVFDRPRPGGASLASAAFPSGHAATSVALYGLLFWLAWWLRLVPGRAAAATGIVVAMALGFSRIYLGEHYLTDVLNGYIVGGLWLLAGAAVCSWMDHRTAVN